VHRVRGRSCAACGANDDIGIQRGGDDVDDHDDDRRAA
jgi:hypothetical protein